MHQFPRSPPGMASPAQSPRTNPIRSNNPREQMDHAGLLSSGRVTPALSEDSASTNVSETDRDSIMRLNQTMQNLYCKGVLMILQDRLELPPALGKKTNQQRINKWFGLDIPESDALISDYRLWKHLDISNEQPPTLIVDIMLSSKSLKSNEALVMQDEYGKTRYVEDAVRSYYNVDGSDNDKMDFDIVLERWQFDLAMFSNQFPVDLITILPKMYKNAVVLFRALFSMLHLLPAWKLSTKNDQRTNTRFLPTLSYRVYPKSQSSDRYLDGLFVPLDDTKLEEYDFETLDTPAGKFRVKVTYRKTCEFKVEVSEAVISSRIDDSDLFKPSLRPRSGESFLQSSRDIMPPPTKSTRQILRDVDQAQQAYGSLSTYHLAGHPLSSSPLSTLRAARELSTQALRDSPPSRLTPERKTSQESQSSLRSEGISSNVRRPSITFSPFKSPSLSSSPSPLSGEHLPTPRVQVPTGNRSSALTALAEARRPGLAQQSGQFPSSLSAAVTGPSSVPQRPIPKYSSSFSHRRSRNSITLSREDDVGSGQGSPRPGSRAGEGNSSGSLDADDDNIADFLKMLDQKKDLKSFRSPTDSSTAENSTRRTTVALSKFSRLRDSNAVLSDSMSSSVLGHRSSTSSSRQLSSVPPMIGGNSLSTASSPGERMSPRTPHTPAIPSRLSANSIAEYSDNRQRNAGGTLLEGNEADDDDDDDDSTATGGAIDIPNSPRGLRPSYRRSSSVAQQNRAMRFGDEDVGDVLPFGMRSTSLGGNGEREPLSLSQILAMQDESGVGILPGPSNHQPPESQPMSRQRSTSSQDDSGYHVGVTSRGAYRGGRGIARAHPGAQGSSTSLTGERGSASGGSDSRGARYSFQRSRDLEDEELLFAMSDFGAAHQQQQGRSGDEGR